MPGRRPRPSLDALAAAQDGIVSRRQAIAHGIPGTTVDNWVRRGRWAPLLPGVYDTVPGRSGDRQRQRAALLYGGPGAALDGLTAARLHGLRLPRDPRIRIAVPADRHIASPEFLVVRRAHCVPQVVRDGLPTLTIEAAVVSASVEMSDEAAVLALLAESVQRRLTTPERLVAAARHAPRHGRAVVNGALADIVAGCRSAPEATFRRLVLRSRLLPEPLWNPLLRLPDGSLVSPDSYWRDAGLVHEVDSREHHLYADGWEATMRRHARLTAAGLTVLHTSPRRLRIDPEAVLREVAATYRVGRERALHFQVEIVRRAA